MRTVLVGIIIYTSVCVDMEIRVRDCLKKGASWHRSRYSQEQQHVQSMLMLGNPHTQAHSLAHSHTPSHTLAHSHTLTHTCSLTHTLPYTCSLTHTHAHSHTPSHTLAHSHTLSQLIVNGGSTAPERSVIMFIITKLHLLPIITELDACVLLQPEFHVYVVLQPPD